ncbi:MAG: hypothetical protein LUE64_06090 [Candidatus Gastranaerophilales bacterium]|nr:hypothetical protein [Candidatus Gastranaerophilales bacterium]
MGKTIGLIFAIQDKCSPNITKIANKLGMTEKEAKKLQTQVAKLSKELSGNLKKACTAVGAGIGAVVATAGVLVNKSMEAGDRIDKMSQKIGMSRKAFQEWDYIMSQNGGAVDNLQMGYKALSNQMEMMSKGSKDSIQYFKRLGVSVKDSRGNFRKQEDVFNDTVRALQRLKNPTEKAIIANKLFGKSAIDMKPLLNQSAESVEQLRKRANDLGMIMSDEAVDAAVKLTDTFDTVKRIFGALGNQIGADLMPTIQSLADELINHLPKIKSALTPILQGLLNTVKFLSEHIQGLSIIATVCLSSLIAYKTISGVISTIKTLQAVIKAVSLAQGVWNALMLANPIGVIAVGIGLVIGGIVLLVKHWDAVKNAFMGFYEKIKPALEVIGKYIKIAFNLSPLGMFINSIKLLVQNWDKVTESVQKAINTLRNFFKIKGKKDVDTGDINKKGKDAVMPSQEDNKPIKQNAVGTSFYSGGKTRINEFGGEIVDLPRGSRIYPHDVSQKMTQNSNKSGIVINVNIMGNMVGNQEFLDKMTNAFAQKLKVAMAVR